MTRFPETPNVHYAFGSFLVNEQADRALEEFKAELKVSQRHPLAKLQIAYEYIRRGEWEAARPWAEQAVDRSARPTSRHARPTARCCSRVATWTARSPSSKLA